MSLQAPSIDGQPEDTARVARAAFPRGNTSMRIDDVLGPISSNPQFARLFPKDGQPALARFEEYRLPDGPVARTALAEQIGADGRRVLTAILATPALARLLQVPAVKTLWRVWLQQFDGGDPIIWRRRRPQGGREDLPPSAVVVSSPYDPDARYSKKRETTWTGDKHPLRRVPVSPRPATKTRPTA